MTEKEIFEGALHKWGIDSQFEMVVEECSELIHAIQKFKRMPNPETLMNLCEEVADVKIMISQIETLEHYNVHIKQSYKDKLFRLMERLSL